MHRVVHHRRWEGVVADEIRDLAVDLYHETVNDVRPRHEPVDKVFFAEERRQVETGQVLEGNGCFMSWFNETTELFQ